MRHYLLILGIFAAFALGLAGSYKLLQGSSINALTEEASVALQNGDYLASLQKYSDLKEKEKDAPVAAQTETKIIESKNFLVAEELLLRAEKAKEEGNWFAVKALLEDEDATTNNSFKNYEQAVALYLEATNKVSELEKKIEAELAKFRQEATDEKARRENAEEVVTEVKQEVVAVTQKLETTTREKEATTAELAAATAQKNAAVEAAVRERFLKFLNELELYTQMLGRGNGYFDDAVSEIEKSKDTSSLILLNQGRVLFDEVSTRADDLLASRTEEQYKDEVRTLLQSAALFTVSARSFGSAVFYIEKKNQDDADKFAALMNEGKAAKQEGMRLLNITKEFIASSR